LTVRQPNDPCSDCGSPGRRDFLIDSLRAGALALASLGLSTTASALPTRFVSANAGGASEKSYAIPAADGVQIDKENEVILSRVGTHVFALVLACPHQNTALRWEAGDKRFQCPKHKSRYTPEGIFIEGRATRSMDRYAVRVAGNAILVDIDRIIQEDLEKAAWQQAVVTLS
jgi:Ferredoxin subunits of nitrite reductase and ring-hydroxylating dioxygenases